MRPAIRCPQQRHGQDRACQDRQQGQQQDEVHHTGGDEPGVGLAGETLQPSRYLDPEIGQRVFEASKRVSIRSSRSFIR
jgi:hypothetical protein